MFSRRTNTLVIAALAASVLLPTTARAGGNVQFRQANDPAVVHNRLWDTRTLPITFYLSHDGFPNSGISKQELADELTAAIASWDTLPTAAVAAHFGGEAPYREARRDGPLGASIDGLNLITFTDPNVVFPPGVLAYALVTNIPSTLVVTSANSDLDGDGVADIPEGIYPAGTILDADIAFNSAKPWSLDGAGGTFDLGAVAVHELGHSIGLCHSMIRDAIMSPFYNSTRTPNVDDVAFASFFYPHMPTYFASFGSIGGRITSGFTGLRILGAHVFAVDQTTGARVVGAYSGDDGSYEIPGLVPGQYLVGIEPLDGDPVGLDPSRVNEVVAGTTDTNFPEEFYDADEASVEADAQFAQAVTVAAGAHTLEVDIITNTVEIPGTSRVLQPGYNLFAYPTEVPTNLTAHELLQALGDANQIVAIERFVPTTGAFERAEYLDGQAAGGDFPIRRGEGYVVYAAEQLSLDVEGSIDCPTLTVRRGLNLIGVPCPPAGYSAFDLIDDLGGRYAVRSVQRFDPTGASFQVASYDGAGNANGIDFSIRRDEGYVVEMFADARDIEIPGAGDTYSPLITAVRPGRGVPGTQVFILGAGFGATGTDNTVTFNGTAAAVQLASTSETLSVLVPAGATSGPIVVTVAGRSSNGMPFIVDPTTIAEDPDGETEIVSGQTVSATLSQDGQQDRYTFTALEGSVVTAQAQPVSGNVPDLILVLEDPFGVMVASDDNSAGTGRPLINNFVLTRTGTHTIVVSNAPGGGVGPYRLHLTVTPQAAPARVSVLDGNIQTTVAGGAFAVPLTILVTGSSGAPMAGVPVSFSATGVDLQASSADSFVASTVLLSSNASGLVTVSATAPNTPGVYEILVTVGDAQPARFHLAVTAEAVASITIEGDGQTGTVDQPLPAPLRVRCLNANGLPVAGALVQYQVASGGGSINPSGQIQSGADGYATTAFRLGRSAAAPQIVAALVPGRRAPLLFYATARAGSPARIEANQTTYQRVTIGTTRFNALAVQVFDQFDNPVGDVPVAYAPQLGSGFSISPGIAPDGTAFTNFRTNTDGLHVAALTIPESVVPTFDEFWDDTVPGLADAYHVTASIPGNTFETFTVGVDMGPTLIVAGGPALHAPIGTTANGNVSFKVLLFRRGIGDFRNLPFNLPKVEQLAGDQIDFRVARADGLSETDAALTPTSVNPASAVPGLFGWAETAVNMGDVGGRQFVIATTEEVEVHYCFDNNTFACPVIYRHDQRFASLASVIADPLIVRAEIRDSGSGIDLRTVQLEVNGHVGFDGANPPLVFPTFPERVNFIVGGQRLRGLPPGAAQTSAFTAIDIEYWPHAQRLNESSNPTANTAQVFPPSDHAGNPHPLNDGVRFFSFP